MICSPASHVPSEKGSTLEGKNLLPRGSLFFPFKADHIPEWSTILAEFSPLKCYQFLLILLCDFVGKKVFYVSGCLISQSCVLTLYVATPFPSLHFRHFNG